MRQEKLGFGVIFRVLISLLPILFEAPILATIMCAYNISMSFIVFGPLTAFVSSLSSICIAMFLGGTFGANGELAGFVLSIQAVLVSAGCIYGYLYKKRFSLGLALSTAGILIPQFLYIQHIASNEGLSIAQSIVPSVQDLVPIMTDTFTDMQVVVSAPEIYEIAVLVNKFAAILLPSIFIITSMVLAYIIIWSVSVQLRKLPIGMYHSFSLIKTPVVMSIVTVLSFIALRVIGYMNVSYEVVSVIMNMFVILFFIHLFAGISVADFYLRRKVKHGFLRAIIHVSLIVFIPIAVIAYAILACIDSFANFRKITTAVPVKEGEIDETKK